MKPRTKDQFKEYCLRALGKPVVNIELDDDQIDDRIDFAFQYYADHHFDGSEKLYYKHQVQANDYPDVVKETIVATGGTGYSNSDIIAFVSVNGAGSNGTANIVTDSTGAIVSTPISNTGSGFQMAPAVVITTSSGSGANVVPQLGGYINIPDNVIGVVDIFDIQEAISSSSFFSIKYQIAINDLYSFTMQSLVPYYMIRQNLGVIEQLLVGKQPIRYNRHKKRMYLDMDWSTTPPGTFLVIVCYEVIDPALYPEVFSDYWLQRYTTQILKQQWGINLKKFSGMQLPGGIVFNGQQIYDEATAEILRMEQEMINSYSPLLVNMVN